MDDRPLVSVSVVSKYHPAERLQFYLHHSKDISIASLSFLHCSLGGI